jgi:hypothetical protein
MNKIFTAASAASLALAFAAVAAPASAQDATLTGVAGGAVAGAVIGGPPGAVIGAIAGGAIGASADTVEQNSQAAAAPADTYVVSNVPPEVGTYALQRPAPAVRVEQPVMIGQPIPGTVQVVRVPDYPSYSYANVNGRTVIVDSQTGDVIGVVRN